MQILGIRTAPTLIRYAVVELDAGTVSLRNASSENRLVFPADICLVAEKLLWLQQELDRVLRQNPEVVRIVIKANEFSRRGETGASREAAYYDAIVFLVAQQRGLPVETVLYRTIGTRRTEVKGFSEQHVSQTSSYWNEQMADAVAAALYGGNTL